MSTSINSTQVDLAYLTSEDRLILTVIKNSINHSHWWLTRRITCALVFAWVEKLEAIGLPEIALQQLKTKNRNLSQEHALSLEFDGPQSKKTHPEYLQSSMLISEITISVSPVDCTLTLKAESSATKLTLTRKETHSFLEMIASKSKQAGWLDLPNWPIWLGHLR